MIEKNFSKTNSNTRLPEVGDLEHLLIPKSHDLGGFSVRRALPAPERQMVGPFIFFDQAGPAEFISNKGVDVRPHPHIGLSTVTYLYKGEFQHKDSLGNDQMIHPGELNWMISGNSVTHSERTSEKTRQNPHSLFGIQTWVALPESAEDDSASFEHFGKPEIPEIEADGVSARLILGTAWGESAPAKTFSEMFYADVDLLPHAQVPLPAHEDRGAYVVQGSVIVSGESYEQGQMMVFRPGDDLSIKAGEQGAKLMLLGGESFDTPRYVWWNFVASSKERIEEAREQWVAADWENGQFSLPPTDNDEFIPAPDKLKLR